MIDAAELTYDKLRQIVDELRKKDIKPWADGCYHFDPFGNYIPSPAWGTENEP